MRPPNFNSRGGEKPKSKVTFGSAWREARELMYAHRWRLALGMSVMLVNRLSGLVLPLTPRYLFDVVIARHRLDLLTTLALAGGLATVVQAASSYALSQILGVAAQRAINDLRRDVQAHVLRLPISLFRFGFVRQSVSRAS